MIAHHEFGRLLTAAREARGLTRTAVAHGVGIGTVKYREIEEGTSLLTFLKFAELQQLLSFDPEELLEALPVKLPSQVKRTNQTGVSHRRDFGTYRVFAVLLIEARRRANLTVANLARLVDTSSPRITHAEGGHGLPKLLLFAKLWRVLDLDAQAFIDAVFEASIEWDEPFSGFGAIVRTARETLGRTSEQIADTISCDLDEYIQVERGSELPTMTELVHLHRELRLDVNSALRAVWSSPRAMKQLT